MKGQRYIVDRVGKETDLEKCSVCHALSCFSCEQDHCTALGKFSTGGCAFYKDAKENRLEIRRCFYRLIRYERFDLLYKYAETLAALGLMDQELKDTEKQRMMLAEYQRTHLGQLCADHWKDSLIVVSASDEEDNNKDDAPADSETQEPDPESEFDNDIDKAVFPETFTDMDIDNETAEEINTRDHIIKEEVKDGQFRPSVLAADILAIGSVPEDS